MKKFFSILCLCILCISSVSAIDYAHIPLGKRTVTNWRGQQYTICKTIIGQNDILDFSATNMTAPEIYGSIVNAILDGEVSTKYDVDFITPSGETGTIKQDLVEKIHQSPNKVTELNDSISSAWKKFKSSDSVKWAEKKTEKATDAISDYAEDAWKSAKKSVKKLVN